MLKALQDILECDESTANRIIELYKIEKELCPEVEFQLRRNSVGVGINGEHLRYYFFNINGTILIKFKFGIQQFVLKEFSNEDFLKHINYINDIFKRKAFLLKKTPRVRKDVQTLPFSRYEFLRYLAKGVNLVTGEIMFTPDDELKTIIANIALFCLEKDKADTNSFDIFTNIDDINSRIITIQSKAESNRGRRWTDEEVEQLKDEYNRGISIKEIARIHKRGFGGIERKLKDLKLIEY